MDTVKRKKEKGPWTTRPHLSLILFSIFVSCVSGANLQAQETGKNTSSPCFVVHVRLNGKPLDGPRVVTVKGSSSEFTLSLQGGCFVVPPALFKEKTLDLVFTLPENSIHLFNISASFFEYPWDIELTDKRFGSDVSLPKHARVKEACFVTFHGGEPERQLTETACRAPIHEGKKAD